MKGCYRERAQRPGSSARPANMHFLEVKAPSLGPPLCLDDRTFLDPELGLHGKPHNLYLLHRAGLGQRGRQALHSGETHLYWLDKTKGE